MNKKKNNTISKKGKMSEKIKSIFAKREKNLKAVMFPSVQVLKHWEKTKQNKEQKRQNKYNLINYVNTHTQGRSRVRIFIPIRTRTLVDHTATYSWVHTWVHMHILQKIYVYVHHHHGLPIARIPFILSSYPSLSVIALDTTFKNIQCPLRADECKFSWSADNSMSPCRSPCVGYIYIYIYIYIKFVTVVEGDPKAPFSIATTRWCRRGHNFFS